MGYHWAVAKLLVLKTGGFLVQKVYIYIYMYIFILAHTWRSACVHI